jgi:hypothetical protein
VSIQQTIDYNRQKNATGSDKMTYDNLFIYHWDTYEDGTFNHLFSVGMLFC